MQTLKATNLVKSYKGRKVVDDVTLEKWSDCLGQMVLEKLPPFIS